MASLSPVIIPLTTFARYQISIANMQLRSGSIISSKVSARSSKKSSTHSPKVVVSTMRLRSGRVVGHKGSMTGPLPFEAPSSGVISDGLRTSALIYIINRFMTSITETRNGSKEENAIQKAEYLESIVSVVSQNMEFMLNVSKWPRFLECIVSKMIQFASDMHYYMNSPKYQFSHSQRVYLREIMVAMVKLSLTVEMKLAAKK